MTMTIPGEQQLVFEAADATEFRALLGRILADSPLSCGQIAIKTGMPRSTAYSLPDTKRPGLPSNPEQVAAFVKACGLTPTQVDLVMDLWNTLHQAAENARSASAVSESNSSPASEGWKSYEFFTSLPREEALEVGTKTLRFINLDEPARQPDTRPRVLGRTVRRDTSWTELLHYVLGAPERTRGAMMLLIPVTVLLLGVVCALVFLAVKMPTTTPLVVAALLSPLLLALRKNGRKPTKKIDS